MGETTIIKPAGDTGIYSPATFEESVVETSPEIEAAKNSIEHTRDEMSETINAIKDHLSPKRLVEEAKEAAVEKVVEVKDAVVEKVADVTHNVVASVSGVAHTIGDKVADFTEGAKEKIYELTHGGDPKPAPVSGAIVYRGSVDNSPKSTGDLFMDVIKENPIPAALVGVGLGWLLVDAIIKSQNAPLTTGGTYTNGTYGAGAGTIYTAVPGRTGFAPVNSPNPTYTPGYSTTPTYSTGNSATIGNDAKAAFEQAGNRLQETGEKIGDALGDAKAKATDAFGDAKAKATDAFGDAREKVTDTAHDLGERASQIADDLKDRASETTTLVQTKASEFGDVTQQNVRKAADATVDFVTGNPLAAGAIALTIGTIVGLMLPSSKPENKLMGTYRDQLADQAGQQAQDLLGKVQTVAGDALGEAKEKLTEVKDSVQTKLAEAKDEVQAKVAEGAKAQGLVPA